MTPEEEKEFDEKFNYYHGMVYGNFNDTKTNLTPDIVKTFIKNSNLSLLALITKNIEEADTESVCPGCGYCDRVEGADKYKEKILNLLSLK